MKINARRTRACAAVFAAITVILPQQICYAEDGYWQQFRNNLYWMGAGAYGAGEQLVYMAHDAGHGLYGLGAYAVGSGHNYQSKSGIALGFEEEAIGKSPSEMYGPSFRTGGRFFRDGASFGLYPLGEAIYDGADPERVSRAYGGAAVSVVGAKLTVKGTGFDRMPFRAPSIKSGPLSAAEAAELAKLTPRSPAYIRAWESDGVNSLCRPLKPGFQLADSVAPLKDCKPVWTWEGPGKPFYAGPPEPVLNPLGDLIGGKGHPCCGSAVGGKMIGAGELTPIPGGYLMDGFSGRYCNPATSGLPPLSPQVLGNMARAATEATGGKVQFIGPPIPANSVGGAAAGGAAIGGAAQQQK